MLSVSRTQVAGEPLTGLRLESRSTTNWSA